MLTSKLHWIIIACVTSVFSAKPVDAFEPAPKETCAVFHKPNTTNPVAKELFEKLDGTTAVKVCKFIDKSLIDGNPAFFTIAKPVFTVGNLIRFQSKGIGILPPPPFSKQMLTNIQSKVQKIYTDTYICIDPQRCKRPFDSGFVLTDQLSDVSYPFIPEIGDNIGVLLTNYAKSLPKNRWREKKWARQLKRMLKARDAYFDSVSDDLVKGYGQIIEVVFKSPSDDYWVAAFLIDDQDLRIVNLEKIN